MANIQIINEKINALAYSVLTKRQSVQSASLRDGLIGMDTREVRYTEIISH